MPEIRFELAVDVRQFHKGRLAELAAEVLAATQPQGPPVGGDQLKTAFEREMNW